MINIELIKLILIIVIFTYIFYNFKSIKVKFDRFSSTVVIISFIVSIGYCIISLNFYNSDILKNLINSILIFLLLNIFLDKISSFLIKNIKKHKINKTIYNVNNYDNSQTNNHLKETTNITNIETVDNSSTINSSYTNNHSEEVNNFTTKVTNIETVDNSKTFNTSQTNNHLKERNNNLKEDNSKKYYKEDLNSKENNINNLSEEQLRKIYNFFIDNNLLVDDNLEFENFKDIFLKEPIRLKADIPTLREFYNHLCVQNNIKFKNINTDFLTFFINSKNNEFYDYKQFTKDSKPISSLTDEILELFKKF